MYKKGTAAADDDLLNNRSHNARCIFASLSSSQEGFWYKQTAYWLFLCWLVV